jgi:RimJ/RimL family protein N-acetyltransferase
VKILYGDRAVVEWVGLQLGIKNFGEAVGIGFVGADNKPLAGVVYASYSEKYRDIEASLASITPRWCTRGNLYAVFAYPFVQLDCERISATVDKANKPARSFVERAGFQVEGKRRGKVERIGYGMLKHECKWLEQ